MFEVYDDVIGFAFSLGGIEPRTPGNPLDKYIRVAPSEWIQFHGLITAVAATGSVPPGLQAKAQEYLDAMDNPHDTTVKNGIF